MEDWVTIRNIKKKNNTIGTRKIARMLGISRNTVKRALASEEYPTCTRTGKVNEQIEPFAGFIKESYIVRRQKVSVIIGNLRSKGFAVSDRKTALILRSVFNVDVSYQTVLNYAAAAAFYCSSFNLKYKGSIDEISAGDEAYIKVMGEHHYVFFFISSESLKITAYHMKPSHGFNSVNGATSLVTLFVTHYNFLRPHMSLKYKTPIELPELEDIDTIQGKWTKILSIAA